jgi:hypothetical protein
MIMEIGRLEIRRLGGWRLLLTKNEIKPYGIFLSGDFSNFR